MAFELQHRKHIEDDLTKTARRELRRAARTLNRNADSTFDDAVHEARKSVKKVRAVAALLEQAGAKLPRKDRKRLKSAARALSTLRDSAAIVDTFDSLRRRYPKQLPEHTYGILRRGLVRARDREKEHARRKGIVGEAAERLTTTRKSVNHWTTPSIDVSGIGAVVADSYRRSRAAMKHARTTGQSAALHAWRKDAKTLWYQLRLARPLTVGVAPLVRDLEKLETRLGDDHNLVVLGATLKGCRDLQTMPADIRQIDHLARRMRDTSRPYVFALGRRLFRRTTKAFAHWIRRSARQPRPSQSAVA